MCTGRQKSRGRTLWLCHLHLSRCDQDLEEERLQSCSKIMFCVYGGRGWGRSNINSVVPFSPTGLVVVCESLQFESWPDKIHDAILPFVKMKGQHQRDGKELQTQTLAELAQHSPWDTARDRHVADSIYYSSLSSCCPNPNLSVFVYRSHCKGYFNLCAKIGYPVTDP